MNQAIFSQMSNLQSKGTITFQEDNHLLEDLEITPKDEADRNELEYVLTKLLGYPSKEKAHLHRDCNKLGSLDLHE